jgi:hypothetical protein
LPCKSDLKKSILAIPLMMTDYQNNFLKVSLQTSSKFFLPCLLLLFMPGCEERRVDKKQNSLADKKIKSILLSVHDPIENTGGQQHYPEVAKHSILVKSIFNRQGALLLQEKVNDLGNLVSRDVFKYNVKGQLLEQIQYQFNKVSEKRVYAYEENEFVEMHQFDANDQITGKETVIFEPNQQKRIIAWTLLKEAYSKKEEKVMDARGNVLELHRYTRDVPAYSEYNRYDDQDNRITSFQRDHTGEKTLHFKYDAANNNIETVVLNSSQMIESTTRSKFDSYRNPLEITIKGIHGPARTEKHRYEYDAFGRWIKDIAYIQGKPVSVTVRRIEYYE